MKVEQIVSAVLGYKRYASNLERLLGDQAESRLFEIDPVKARDTAQALEPQIAQARKELIEFLNQDVKDLKLDTGKILDIKA